MHEHRLHSLAWTIDCGIEADLCISKAQERACSQQQEEVVLPLDFAQYRGL